MSKRLQPKLSIFTLLLFGLLSNGTLAYSQYCSPSYTTGCGIGDQIDFVQFNTISKTTIGCTAAGPAFVNNFTKTDSTLVFKGQSYTFTAGPGVQYDQYIGVWIDWNGDGDWQDANEFHNLGQVTAGQTASTSITVPAGATTGSTRMRVLCDFSNPLSQISSCLSATYGEAEDYTINVVDQQQTDATLLALDAPATSCGMGSTESVIISVINSGLDTITTFQACFIANGGSTVCETVNTTILPGDTSSYTFTATANLSTFGWHTMSAWVALTGDSLAINDSLMGLQVENQPVISTLPYFQDFENGKGGWSEGGTSSSWAFGQPFNVHITGANSGDSAWVNNLTGDYNDDESSYLISPCIDFSGLTFDPMLSFAHIWSTEQDFDEGWVEVSTNAGQTWSKLGSASSGGQNWYNDSQDDNWTGVSGNAGQWKTARHTLTGTAGNSDVKIRFRFDSDGSLADEGFGVDDILIADSVFDGTMDLVTNPISGCGLSASETVSIKIKNDGTVPISGFQVCYSLQGGASNCETFSATINPGDSANHSFSQTVNVGSLGSYNLDVWLVVPNDLFNANDTIKSLVNHVKTVSSFPYVEDFENGSVDWQSAGSSSTWAFGTPAKTVINGAASGDSAWVTGGLGTTTYNAAEASWVLGPCFDFTNISNPWVKLSIWWESETVFDGATLQTSTDGGNTWITIGSAGDTTNWFTHSTLVGFTDIGNNFGGWSGTSALGSGGWVTAQHPLDNMGGKSSVFVRIFFAADGSVQEDGFAFDDIVVSQGPPPSVFIGPDTTVCGPYVLNPNKSSGSYKWSTGDTTATLVVKQSGIYFLGYADASGLCGFDTVTVQILNTPVDLGPDTTICDNETFTFDGGIANTTYNWSNNATTQTITVSAPGSYSVTVVDANQCASSDTVVLGNIPSPLAVLANDTTVCPGDTICMGSGLPNGLSYSWNNGDTNKVICPVAAGIYIVTIDDGTCQDTDTLSIFNFGQSTVNLGPDQPICTGDSVCLTAGLPINTYNWSNGGTGTTQCFTTPGSVWVECTNAQGCVAKDTMIVFSGSVPSLTLADTTACSGGTVCITAGPVGPQYQWSTGDTSATACVGTGSHTVTATSADGCVATDSVDVTSIQAPVASFTIDTTGCPVITFVDNSTGTITNRVWEFGDGGVGSQPTEFHDYTSSGNGTYVIDLIVTNLCGSDTITDSIVITCITINREDPFTGDVAIYPNPTQGKFTVQITPDRSELIGVSVVDVTGKAIYSSDLGYITSMVQHEVDLGHAAKGVYFVKIKTESQELVTKLVID